MKTRKWTSLLLAWALVLTSVFSGNIRSSAAADGDQTERVTVYVAAQGHSKAGSEAAISKTPVQVNTGSTAADVVQTVLDASGYAYDMQDTGWGPYLESINGMGTEQEGNDWYYWSFYINGNYSEVGLGGYEVQDNDKISLIYSYEDASTEAADFVDDETKNPTDEQAASLVTAAKEQQTVLAEKIYQHYFGDGTIPGIENYASDLYVVFSLLRAGYEAPEFYQKVYSKVEGQLYDLQNTGRVTVKETNYETGEDVETELTEETILSWGTAELYYAKIVLALSAMGKDATKVGGFDLIARMADQSVYESSKQAYMCTPTVLLALDSGEYALPEGENYVTRTQLVNDIVDTFGDNMDLAIEWGNVDMVAMPLQALAPYRQEDNLAAGEQKEAYQQDKINRICTRGIHFLESMQSTAGLYGSSWSPNNAWSLAQVMTAMGQFGIDAASEKDGTDFIKNGVTVYAAAAAFVNAEEGSVDEDLMGYQPEQLLRGLNSCIRVSEGQDSLYDTTKCEAIVEDQKTQNPQDTSSPAPSAPAAASATPAAVSQSPAPAASASAAAVKTIKVKKITVKKGSRRVKGTLNVKKAKVTVTIKRGSKKVTLKTTVSGKNFTATLTKAKAKKLIKGKATKAKRKKNQKLLKKDKITVQAAKSGYKKLKKVYTVKK